MVPPLVPGWFFPGDSWGKATALAAGSWESMFGGSPPGHGDKEHSCGPPEPCRAAGSAQTPPPPPVPVEPPLTSRLPPPPPAGAPGPGCRHRPRTRAVAKQPGGGESRDAVRHVTGGRRGGGSRKRRARRWVGGSAAGAGDGTVTALPRSLRGGRSLAETPAVLPPPD